MKLIQLLIGFLFLFAFSCSEPKTDIDSNTANSISKTLPPPNEETPQNHDASINETETAENELPQNIAASDAKEHTVAEEPKKTEAKTEVDLKKEELSDEQLKAKEKARAERHRKRKEEKARQSKSTAKIKFKETEYDFGVITQGDKIKHDFVFENVGDADLEILNVDVTCGCTTPTFPFIPIAPGEKGTIGVTYNSTGKLGNQKPMITIVSNAKPHTTKIYLKGVVDAERAKSTKEKVETKENR